MKRLPLLSLALAAASAFLVAASTPPAISATLAQADPPTCHGQPATIVTTGAAVTGTPGNDVIVASGYGTQVDAGAGDDLVCLVGPGGATVDAGPGDDTVDATAIAAGDHPRADLGPGSDVYLGGDGYDQVASGTGAGDDVISTAGGRDAVTVASSNVDVSLGSDHDHLTVAPGSLGGGRLRLGSSRDLLEITARDSHVTLDLLHRRLVVGDAGYRLRGDEVADVTAYRADLVGTSQREVLTTTACTATIAGGAGADRLTAVGIGPHQTSRPCPRPRARVLGGAGNDTLVGDRGHIDLIGGRGVDHATGRAGEVVCQAERETHCDR